uniref:Uncharacterized protein n=1 Tax=Opuntia streptacantha TaxID=393608 RepID=A0A7C9AX17_OPUST
MCVLHLFGLFGVGGCPNPAREYLSENALVTLPLSKQKVENNVVITDQFSCVEYKGSKLFSVVICVHLHVGVVSLGGGEVFFGLWIWSMKLMGLLLPVFLIFGVVFMTMLSKVDNRGILVQ